MLEYEIPGFRNLKIDKVVIDFNGTLACDGEIIADVKERLRILTAKCDVIVLTADTFGTVQDEFADMDIEIEIIDSDKGREYKSNFIEKLGSKNVIAIGNGNNDQLMLEKAVLGILIIGDEGAATESLLASDTVIKDINDALDLLIKPGRLIASLRR